MKAVLAVMAVLAAKVAKSVPNTSALFGVEADENDRRYSHSETTLVNRDRPSRPRAFSV
jgi:hypothetical protein